MRTVKLGSLGLEVSRPGPGCVSMSGFYGACFQGRNFERDHHLPDAVRALTKEQGVASAQPELAWVVAQDDDIVPIPRRKRRSYLEENTAAIEAELTAGGLGRIDAVFPKGAAAGERHPDVSSVNRCK